MYSLLAEMTLEGILGAVSFTAAWRDPALSRSAAATVKKLFFIILTPFFG
jgi:hypothetical protein